MKKTKLIGITGGIGSGKSTVSDILRAEGYTVLSADAFARQVTTAGSSALQEIAGIFGPESILPNGELNRSFVRNAIACDPSLRLKLDATTHPRIQALTQTAWEELCTQEVPLAFYEAALLFEAHSEKRMHKVICVHAREDLRIQRIMKRDGVDKAKARALLRTQMSQEEKMKHSDYLLANEGSLEDLRRATLEILEKILADPTNANSAFFMGRRGQG